MLSRFLSTQPSVTRISTARSLSSLSIYLPSSHILPKVRLFGAIEAFRRGRLPTNKQLDRSLEYVRDHSPLDIDQLSPQGRKLIQDLREIINTTRLVLQDKNADELLQNFIWHTRDIDRDVIAPGNPAERLPLDRETARSDSQKGLQLRTQSSRIRSDHSTVAARHLRTLLHIILTNSEARKLFSDFSVIGRDLLSKTAAKASETIAPSEEELRRADEVAPEDQFISAGGRRVGLDTTPTFEASIPGTRSTIRSHPSDHGTRLYSQEGVPRPIGDIQEGIYRARSAGEEVTREVGGRAHGHAQDIRSSDTPEQEIHAKKAGFMGKMKDVTVG